MSIMLTKIAILLYFLRLITWSRALQITVYSLITIVVIYSIVASWKWVYACRPLQKYWDFTITDCSCLNWQGITIFSGAMNSLTDFIILILPFALLRGLKSLPMVERIGVMLIMMTGGLYVKRERETSLPTNWL